MVKKNQEGLKAYHLIVAENRLHHYREKVLVRLGNEIRERGWTQKEAAEYLAVSQPRISDVVTGKSHKFTLDKALEMAIAMDIPVTLDLNPSLPQGRSLTSDTEFECHQSILFYSDIIDHNPDDSTAYARRARAHWHLGQLEDAKNDYLRSAELDPGRSGPRSNLVIIYQKLGEYENALREVDHLQAHFPDESFDANLGLVLVDLERYDEALVAYEKAIKADPVRPGPHWNRAQLFEKLGQKRDALLDYQAVLRLDPTYQRAQQALEQLVESSD